MFLGKNVRAEVKKCARNRIYYYFSRDLEQMACRVSKTYGLSGDVTDILLKSWSCGTSQ